MSRITYRDISRVKRVVDDEILMPPLFVVERIGSSRLLLVVNVLWKVVLLHRVGTERAQSEIEHG